MTHSGLDDVLGTNRPPWNSRGVALGVDGDRLAVDDEFAILGLDGSLEATMDGIVLEHIDLFER